MKTSEHLCLILNTHSSKTILLILTHTSPVNKQTNKQNQTDRCRIKSCSLNHLQLTFLTVFPIITQRAVTFITIPLRPAGPPISTRTFHTWVHRIQHVDSISRTNCNGDGAIIEYQLGRRKERRWIMRRRIRKYLTISSILKAQWVEKNTL